MPEYKNTCPEQITIESKINLLTMVFEFCDDEVITESFAVYEKFLSFSDIEELEEMQETGFQNMGFFYVVGNEMVRSILQKEGIENFRKILEASRRILWSMAEISN